MKGIRHITGSYRFVASDEDDILREKMPSSIKSERPTLPDFEAIVSIPSNQRPTIPEMFRVRASAK